MRCLKRLLATLLFSFLVLQVSFSLSQKEKDTLPQLPKQDLIEIILVMDQGLFSLETSLSERQKELELRVSDLKKSEKILIERDLEQSQMKALLKTQEELYLKSYAAQVSLLKKNNWLKIGLYISGGVILAETIYLGLK
jgi:hypothetical protein